MDESSESDDESNGERPLYLLPFRENKASFFAVPGGLWAGDWAVVVHASKRRAKCLQCFSTSCRHCKVGGWRRTAPRTEKEQFDSKVRGIPDKWRDPSRAGYVRACSVSQYPKAPLTSQRLLETEYIFGSALRSALPLHLSDETPLAPPDPDGCIAQLTHLLSQQSLDDQGDQAFLLQESRRIIEQLSVRYDPR